VYPVWQIIESKTLDLNLPPGEILIHAGDRLPDDNQAQAFADHNDWLGTLPSKHRVVIAGNPRPAVRIEAGSGAEAAYQRRLPRKLRC
jgi:hypothetical protein